MDAKGKISSPISVFSNYFRVKIFDHQNRVDKESSAIVFKF